MLLECYEKYSKAFIISLDMTFNRLCPKTFVLILCNELSLLSDQPGLALSPLPLTYFPMKAGPTPGLAQSRTLMVKLKDSR